MTEQAALQNNTDTVALTSEIVAAYVSNNPVPRTELATLIANIYSAIERLRTGTVQVEETRPTPAVTVRKSVTPDYIICLEDGKKFKSLKRHLATHHNLTPEEYRQKWNLPHDYPMVAPGYAQARSALAKSMGLGRKRAETEPAPATAKPKRAPRKPSVAAETPAAAPVRKSMRRKKAEA